MRRAGNALLKGGGRTTKAGRGAPSRGSPSCFCAASSTCQRLSPREAHQRARWARRRSSNTASYYIPGKKLITSTTPQAPAPTPQAEATTPQAGATTPQAGATTPQAGATTPQAPAPTPQAGLTTPSISLKDLPVDLQNELKQLKQRVPSEEMDDLILRLCAAGSLTRRNLAMLLCREESNLRQKLKSLIEKGQLHYLYPEMPNHPNQAYIRCKRP